MLVLLCIMWMNIPDHHKVYTVFTEHLIISMLATVVIYMLTEYINTSNQLFLQLKKNAETDYLTSLHNLRQFERCCRNVFSKPSISANGWVFLSWTLITSKITTPTAMRPEMPFCGAQQSDEGAFPFFDEVSRNGGEEFSVLVPEATIDETAAIAERIRRRSGPYLCPGRRNQDSDHRVDWSCCSPRYDSVENARSASASGPRAVPRQDSGRNRVCSAPEINDLILS